MPKSLRGIYAKTLFRENIPSIAPIEAIPSIRIYLITKYITLYAHHPQSLYVTPIFASDNGGRSDTLSHTT